MASHVPSCEILDDVSRRDLIRRLFNIGAVNFEGVQLKTGEISPVYFDIRLTMSHPVLLNDISRYMWKWATKFHESSPFSLIVGVPAAAVPLATGVSFESKIPMILCRSAAKDYGTKRKLEGTWEPGFNCLVIEDVVTYGDSIAGTTDILRSHGLRVEHALVVVERQQGATDNLFNNHGVQLHALVTFNDFLTILLEDSLISEEQCSLARSYNARYQYSLLPLPNQLNSVCFFPELGQKIFAIMQMKSTRLCLSIDTSMSSTELLSLAERVGSNICALGMHLDLITDLNADSISCLRKLADDLSFILIDDRKFGDIDLISSHQLSSGPFKVNDWCDLVTIHALPGPGILKAIRASKSTSSRALSLGALIVAELPVKDSLIDYDYRSKCVNMAIEYHDVVIGFASQKPLDNLELFGMNDIEVPNMFYLVSGILHAGVSSQASAEAIKPFSKCPKCVILNFNLSSSDLDDILSVVAELKLHL